MPETTRLIIKRNTAQCQIENSNLFEFLKF